MSDCKLLHVQLSFQSTLTHKWGLEQNHFISNSCIFSWLCTAVAFQRGSRFCPLAHVRTFLPALSFKLYYVDLDFIERGSLSEARSDVMAGYGSQVRGLSAVFTERMQLYAQKGNFEFWSSSFETDSLNVLHPLDFLGLCISQRCDLYLQFPIAIQGWLSFKPIKAVHWIVQVGNEVYPCKKISSNSPVILL